MFLGGAMNKSKQFKEKPPQVLSKVNPLAMNYNQLQCKSIL